MPYIFGINIMHIVLIWILVNLMITILLWRDSKVLMFSAISGWLAAVIIWIIMNEQLVNCLIGNR